MKSFFLVLVLLTCGLLEATCQRLNLSDSTHRRMTPLYISPVSRPSFPNIQPSVSGHGGGKDLKNFRGSYDLRVNTDLYRSPNGRHHLSGHVDHGNRFTVDQGAFRGNPTYGGGLTYKFNLNRHRGKN